MKHFVASLSVGDRLEIEIVGVGLLVVKRTRAGPQETTRRVGLEAHPASGPSTMDSGSSPRRHCGPQSRPTQTEPLRFEITRDAVVPLDDDPQMENGWRCIPVPPTDDPRWFIYDSSRDWKTVWAIPLNDNEGA